MESLITDKEAELMQIIPEWEDKCAEETEAREKLQTAEMTVGTLYAKQGRTSQFATQKERDAHLKLSIAREKESIETREKQEKDTSRNLVAAKADWAETTALMNKLRVELDGQKASIAELSAEETALKEEHMTKVEKRK